eukprot:10328262-Alexandrium_andersonii.AAC.1
MQHACALAGQGCLAACNDGGRLETDPVDEQDRHPPNTFGEVEAVLAAIIDSGMAGPLPDLGPEDCPELCFTRETAKLAYQGTEGGHESDPVFLGPVEHLAAGVYVQPGKKSQ